MNRRDFLITSLASLVGSSLITAPIAGFAQALVIENPRDSDPSAIEYGDKIKFFNQPQPSDLYLEIAKLELLQAVVRRFERLQSVVGHAYFHLQSFDDALKVAQEYTSVGEFTTKEIAFLESVFYSTASQYGFYGQKPITQLTERLPIEATVRIPHTGNYLFKGDAMESFMRIKTAIGEDLILTSGIRSIVKQFFLFLRKVMESDGNFSMASRSLAPPGYSYHGIGDFDVGQANYGALNFTAQFVKSRVFLRLRQLGYLRLRYTQDNHFGVRFEPWHIRVVNL